MKFTFAGISRYLLAIGLLCLTTFGLLQAQQGPRRLIISASNQIVPAGQTQSLTVKAAWFHGPQSSAPFSGKIHWTSSNGSVAAIANGLVTAGNTGTVKITAISGPATGSILLAVVPNQPLIGLSISPKPPNPVAMGTPQQFQAIANYSGTSQDVTPFATWTSSNHSIALVNASGTASTLGIGNSTITASFGGFSDSTMLTVSSPIDMSFLPPDRVTTWIPGLMAVGGIPNRTTVCATIQASTYGNGTQDASSGIQAALDSCPANQVVLLSTGTFTVNNFLLIHSSISLRGAGAGTTILQKTNGAKARIDQMHPIDPGTYTYDAQPIIIVGPNRWPKTDDTTSQNLAADGVKGAYSVTLSNASGFSAGQFVLLDELSGASWQPTPTGFPGNAKVWQGDRVAWNMHLPQQQYQDDSDFSDATGPYDMNGNTRTLPAAMSWFSRTDRAICEVKEIKSVNGNTVTFTTPLHISYRTSHTAQLTRYADTFVTYAGVEGLSTYGGADGQIRFEDAAYSWAKNTEVTQWIGEGFALSNAFRVEIRDSYIHTGSWPEPGGAGYAISFADASSEVLVENNIFIDACKDIVSRSSGAGSVIGYNYMDDAWDFTSPTWQEVSLNGSHMAGPHHMLFEGNLAFNADSDYTHGNAIDHTFFRNWLTGKRRSFTNDQNARTVGLAYGAWWFSFVGNVLGRPGQMSGWTYEDPAMTGNNANWQDNEIWKLGYDPERWDMYADPVVLSSVIRDGNYDYVTASVHWHNTPATFVIPASLYLLQKPAFMGANPWPWVNPGAGTTSTLPAKARFDAGTPNTVP